jgi:hypothetical protein
VSTLVLYTCPVCLIRGTPRQQPRPHVIVPFYVVLQLPRRAARKCKDEKWTRLMLRIFFNHKIKASVQRSSGLGDSIDRDTVSTLVLYTCRVIAI